jgi:hypothetical protein
MRHSLTPLGWFALLFAIACGDDGAAGTAGAGSSSSSGGGSTGTTGHSGTTTAQTGTSSTGLADTSGGGGSSTGGSTGSESSSSSSSGGDSTTGAVEPDASVLFTDVGITRIELTLAQTAIDALGAAPSSYVHADAHLELPGGEIFDLPDIGVRLKGVYGSFRTLDQKAAFLVRFDEYDPDQEPLGLEKLALNNMVQDPSMIHEQLAYALFRDAGVPAPRTGYAQVWLNDEPYGLYSMVEPADNSEFLQTWFDDDDGNLYEGAYGSDFYPGWGPSFDLDNGTDVDFADLETLAVLLDGLDDPDTLLDDADNLFDFQHYLQFAATEIFIGHWDGYAWTRNNYSIYNAPDGRWNFIPWGTDQTFFDYLPIWGGGGRLQQMCDQSLPCRQALADAFSDVIDRVDTLALVDRCDSLLALIDQAMQDDPRKEYDAATVYWAVGLTQDFLLNRPADVIAQFDCTDPTQVDGDGDGAPGCGFDCNDADPNVYPGAPEQCNVVDDNCNGLLDDNPACPPCIEAPASQGGNYAFCFQPLGYAEAEADCVDQGGHLASIHDLATHNEIVGGAYSVAGGLWWIGLDDRVSEGDFEWTDGTPHDFDAWAGGEPNDYDNAEDCAHLADWAGGAWNDLGCGAVINYVCWLP